MSELRAMMSSISVGLLVCSALLFVGGFVAGENVSLQLYLAGYGVLSVGLLALIMLQAVRETGMWWLRYVPLMVSVGLMISMLWMHGDVLRAKESLGYTFSFVNIHVLASLSVLYVLYDQVTGSPLQRAWLTLLGTVALLSAVWLCVDVYWFTSDG